MREVLFDDVALGEEVRKVFLHSVRDTIYLRCIISSLGYCLFRVSVQWQVRQKSVCNLVDASES